MTQNPKEPAGQDEHPLVASAGSQDLAGKSMAPGPRATASMTARYLSLSWQQQQRASARPTGVGAQPVCGTLSWTLVHSTCMMLFLLWELVQWLGFTASETFVHLLGVLCTCWVFCALLALCDYSQDPSFSWLNMFVPFFTAHKLGTYFPTIISMHLLQDREKWLAVLSLFCCCC